MQRPLAPDGAALKVVSTGNPTPNGAPVSHDQAPDKAYLMDEVGDIAYRCGEVGVWLRTDGKWHELPTPWAWETEQHRQWRVL